MAPKRKAAIEATVRLRATKKVKAAVTVNKQPTQVLDVYVFGSGENGELGLGAVRRGGKMPTGITRPRLNDLLDATTVGVVQLAVGGMHCVAITKDNKIYTWGVNDDGALGRDTAWDAPMKSADGSGSDSDDDDDDSGLNPLESTPTAISADDFQGTPKWVQVAATDSASFALTATGEVYGWGTFIGGDGPIGFSLEGYRAGLKKQTTPVKIPELSNIKSLAAGGNHMLALDHTGNVWSWGDSAQFQLGREYAEKYRYNALRPALQTNLHRGDIIYIAAGAYHSFAIDSTQRVWAWGLNNYGQTGIIGNAGEDNAVVKRPSLVRSLCQMGVTAVEGGLHHSIACTEDGSLFSWGRCDDGQIGVPKRKLPKGDVLEERILLNPVLIPDINAKSVAAGIDNSFAIDSDGKVFSWGFSQNYRTGQGKEETVDSAWLLENTAVKNKKLSFAGCGGQFSVLAGSPADVEDEDEPVVVAAKAVKKGRGRPAGKKGIKKEKREEEE
ncbi:RCC1/BLIP-II [Acephala macrosclerotiorum]|nr:RCC1/BLIP-II [Acephala macrosclerotiorum]